MDDRHIVAFGGGGFSDQRGVTPLDRYALSLTGSSRPRVCFVPTASGDATGYIERFYAAFTRVECEPSHLSLFQPPYPSLPADLASKDVVYVGGGSTANMLAVWRLHGVDEALRAAWNEGVVLCGISAGSLCWFEGGITDSFGRLRTFTDGLGLLRGSHCPHYDAEPDRRPAFHRAIAGGDLPAGFAADDGVGLHFAGAQFVEAVAERENGAAYRVEALGSIREQRIEPRLLEIDDVTPVGGWRPMSHVFHRVPNRTLPRAVRAEGVWIEDADGRRYLDGAGGAIVVGVGHGDRTLVDAMAEQSARTSYVHGTAFTTDALEDYADALAPLLPLDEPRIYPVSGGSEAVETAIKLARAYHLARGEPDRTLIVGRNASYHGNTIGTLDIGGKIALRAPYEPWLGRFPHVEAAYEYRCPNPGHPSGCGAWHAGRLERAIAEAGPGTVAAFVAEPVAGATLAAAAPTDDYWPAVAAVCRRHGVLLIADEVMTGFGRTGRWFGVDHWRVRPDLLAAGKGTTSGYVPFGFAACSGVVFETVRDAGGFVHGFTWSHNGVGAAVAHAALRRLADDDLVQASARQGERLLKGLSALADDPIVGDVRGIGLMIGVELVADQVSKAPFPRADHMTERVVAAARERGLLLYSSTGHVDGREGDLIMLGPPFVISDEECDLVVERMAAAIASASPS